MFSIQAVVARSDASAQAAAAFIGAGLPGTAAPQHPKLPDADVWMLSVPDSQLAPLAVSLAANAIAGQRHPLAFHCSGALGSDALGPLRDAGWQVASAHPLLSFASPALASGQFAGTPCALEGDAAALSELGAAFSRIGGRCFTLAAQDKLLYHAGAVFATNFLPVLQDLAERLWQRSGMPEDLALQLRATLLHNAVNNIVALGPQAALTGPAARGDVALVARQAQAVAHWCPEAGAAYAALSQLASALAHPQPAASAQGLPTHG